MQFITDDGDIYQCPVSGIQRLISGHLRGPGVIPCILPLHVEDGRFPKSKLYDPHNLVQNKALEGKDGLKTSTKKVIERKKNYEDKVTW